MADLQMIPFIDDKIEHNGKRKPNEEEFCREVEKKFTPYVGQEFLEIEEAVTFYKIYAIACGFDVRKYTTKRWRGGEIKSKLFVCNREGFTHKGQVESSGRQDSSRKHKVRRVGCKARIRLFMRNGELLIGRFYSVHNHELISARDREFQKLSWFAEVIIFLPKIAVLFVRIILILIITK
ncbi:protein FAR1-RELATED SEQUENCE 5-like [Silene latifolia]|uniref:protein FAR1-RELATED SEQUENCE 5-like n=1 Tax=Silene latifolia TaxID=37657 RepID=UPI003D771E07